MDNEGVVAERQPEVLASASDVVDRPPGEVGDESVRSGWVAADRAWMQDRDPLDPATHGVGGESATDDLDLREFRHR
jgi:hypothetical protein